MPAASASVVSATRWTSHARIASTRRGGTAGPHRGGMPHPAPDHPRRRRAPPPATRLRDQPFELGPPVGVGLGEIDARAQHGGGEVDVDLFADAVDGRSDRAQLLAQQLDELGEGDRDLIGGGAARGRGPRHPRPVGDGDRAEPVRRDPRLHLCGEGVELPHGRDARPGEPRGVVARPSQGVRVLADRGGRRLEPRQERLARGIRCHGEPLERVAHEVHGCREPGDEPRRETGVERAAARAPCRSRKRRPQHRVPAVRAQGVERRDRLALQLVLALEPRGSEVAAAAGPAPSPSACAASGSCRASSATYASATAWTGSAGRSELLTDSA